MAKLLASQGQVGAVPQIIESLGYESRRGETRVTRVRRGGTGRTSQLLILLNRHLKSPCGRSQRRKTRAPVDFTQSQASRTGRSVSRCPALGSEQLRRRRRARGVHTGPELLLVRRYAELDGALDLLGSQRPGGLSRNRLTRRRGRDGRGGRGGRGLCRGPAVGIPTSRNNCCCNAQCRDCSQCIPFHVCLRLEELAHQCRTVTHGCCSAENMNATVFTSD